MIRLKVSNAGSSLRLMAAVVAALLFANSDSAMAGPLKLSNYLIFSETDLTTSSNAIGGNIYSSGNINGNATVTGNATAVGNISNNLTVSGTETSGTSSLGALDSNASVLALLGSHVT